ncbi:type II secretion system F family protein [Methanolobus sediminis]|uniref:Type II secretion system F family protein n=1 Tax=Methanolobus sediminis TaxID=3072978 RepID=A0AA51YM85_9EURY|nr:type II secretion system F family protein [Methanolobus sediminis]WMW25677.1 type II secretion system F family protein [Methanolobus sediminis]
MANPYFIFAYNLFGKYYEKKRVEFFGLRHNLLKNRLDLAFDVYMSAALLSSLLSALVALLGISFLFVIFGVPDVQPTRIMIPVWMTPYLQYKSIVLGVFFAIMFTVVVFAIVYKLFLVYPAIMAGDRKRRIDTMLPYAVNYMSAMSGAGVLPVDLFRSLANNDIYGEMAVECRYLVRDLEILGKDLVTAMKNLSVTTPSTALQDFMQGAITVVASGGQLEPYFEIKTEQYIMENRQNQKEFLETLGLLGETYVTAFVAGPLFLVVVISIMSIMGSAQMIFLYIIIYALIPIGSIMYVILISMMTPEA